jgi:Tol biopolymer transport system component
VAGDRVGIIRIWWQKLLMIRGVHHPCARQLPKLIDADRGLGVLTGATKQYRGDGGEGAEDNQDGEEIDTREGGLVRICFHEGCAIDWPMYYTCNLKLRNQSITMQTSPRLSIVALLLAGAGALVADQSVQLVTPHPPMASLTAAGDSLAPVLSADGQRLVFLSTADDLVTNGGNGGLMDVFVRDRDSDETILVSVGQGGGSGNGASHFATISADGRYVVFVSEADNLVEQDNNGLADVFVRDLLEGTTRLVSVATNGYSGRGRSGSPSITANGRWIVFESDADDLVAGDPNEVMDIFLFDQQDGTVTRLSSPSADPLVAQRPTGPSRSPLISADGSTVLFTSDALNLAPPLASGAEARTNHLYVRRPLTAPTRMVPLDPPPDTARLMKPVGYSLSGDGRHVAVEVVPMPNTADFPRAIYWLDLDDGTYTRVAPELITASTSTRPGPGWPYISADGQHVVLESRVDRDDGTTRAVVWIWEVDSGETVRISSGGLTHAPGIDPSLAVEVPFGELVGSCPNGEFIAFVGGHPDEPPDELPARQLMVRRQSTGELRRISRRLDGGAVDMIDYPAVTFSADGLRLAFQSQARDLVEGDRNEAHDIFLYDWDTSSLELVSVREPTRSSATALGAGMPWPGGLSADGRYLVYVSADAELTGAEYDGMPNIFVLDLHTGANELVSVNEAGSGPGNGASIHPVISANGRRIAFTSLASDMVAGDTNRVEDIFVRDLDLNITFRASHDDGEGAVRALSPAISPDGKWVAFEREAEPFSQRHIMLFEVDSQAVVHVAVRASDGLPSGGLSIDPRFSADGRLVFFRSEAADLVSPPLSSGWRGYAYEIATGELEVLSAEFPATSVVALTTRHRVATDGSGRWVVFPRQHGLALRDLQTGEVTSLATNTLNPSMSADGRWVACEWMPKTGAYSQILVTDLQTGQSTLVSAAHGTQEPADGHSCSPWMSGDGRFVVYTSRAGNLVPGPDNHATDLYLWDRDENRTLRLSVGADGEAASGLSYAPVVAADGPTLVFGAFADNLVEGDRNRRADLFLVALPGPESGFRIATIRRVGAGVTTLHWAAEPGRSYSIEFTDELEPVNWQLLDVPILVQEGMATAEDVAVGATQQRYYRIAVTDPGS